MRRVCRTYEACLNMKNNSWALSKQTSTHQHFPVYRLAGRFRNSGHFWVMLKNGEKYPANFVQTVF